MIDRRYFIAGLSALALGVAARASAHRSVPAEIYQPQLVNTRRRDWLPAELHVVPDEFFLYFMLYGGLAIRYGVGVGRGRLYHAGTFTVGRKAEWPWWRPTELVSADVV